MGGGTGFDGDEYGGRRYFGLYMGSVVDRNDPQGDGRVRVKIPGIIDDRSAWARPRGGGYTNWGIVKVPPPEADVYVQFINGDLDQPTYEPADMGNRGKDGSREMFKEFEDPDIVVAGFGPFRLVVDMRSDEASGLVPTCRLKQIATVNGEEQDVAWIEFGENSIQVYADSAVQCPPPPPMPKPRPEVPNRVSVEPPKPRPP